MADATETTVVDGPEAENDTRSFLIGIGASAGGLEAIRTLLRSVPEDVPAAYVVVQHISPTHRSMLSSLIDRETQLEVHELEESTVPVASHVYVVPPNRDVIYKDGELHLIPPSQAPSAPKPSVDRFFKSIADELHDHAVGIVLSGTGSDGAYGIQAIREAGGITIAQDSATAKYDGMPNSAIETGCVDLVLSPIDIGHRLSNLSNLPQRMTQLLDAQNESPPLSEILQVVLARTRVDFRDYKPTTVLRRLERRMVALGIETQEDYAKHCRTNPNEVDALFRDLLISVTRFFRDPEEFEGIRKYIEDLVEAAEDRTIRVWIAGCATGEEAYSIAILLIEALGGLASVPGNKLQIFATDIDENALRTARAGRYPLGALNDIPKDYLDTYFLVDEVSATVRQDLKNMIIFSTHNVFQDPPFMHIDLICCRNLLIYFGPLLQTQTFSNFHYSLRARGGLFLGTADSTSATPELFSKSDYNAHILLKRGTSNFDHRARARHIPLMVADTKSPQKEEPERTSLRPSNHVNALVKALVKSLGEDAVLMSQDLNIVRIFGDLTRYISLKDGDVPQLNHLILVEPLAREIRVLSTLAMREGEAKTGIVRRLERDPDFLTQVAVYPLSHDDLIEDLFLVTIRRSRSPIEENSASSDEDGSDTLIDELRRELLDTQSALTHSVEEWETANEKLKVSNEELQSHSEELQSINEEMETSNEELQSTNEELVTVNDALQLTTSEMTEINEELGAILDQIELPMLIIDRNLHVSKNSKAATKLFRLTSPATNPHISQIPLPPGFPLIGEIAKNVLFTGESASCDFVSGSWPYTLTCSAYASDKGMIQGVTMIFATSDAARELQQLMDQMPAYLIHRKPDGTILRASRRSATAFGTTAESMKGKKLQDFLHPEDGQKILERDDAFLRSEKDFETTTYSVRSALNGETTTARSEQFRFIDPRSGEESIYSVGIDIAELIETEHELVRTNAEMQLILHHAPFFVLNRDSRGKVLLINKAYAEALGTTVEDATGQNIRDLFHPDDADRITKEDIALLSGQLPPGRKREKLRLKGDKERLFHVSRKILEGAASDGSDTVCSVSTDITEAVRFREAKALMVRDLESAIGQSNVSIMRLTGDGIVNDINTRGAERLGDVRNNIINRSLRDFLTPEVAASVIDRASRFLRDVEASAEFFEEFRLLQSPDKKSQVLIHWIRVPGDEGGSDEIFSIGRTIETDD